MRPIVAGLGATLLLAAACSSPPVGASSTGAPSPPTAAPSSVGPPPILLGVIATTSGPTAQDDEPYVEGMQAAVDAVNAGGGIGGRPLALVVRDDAGDPSRAATLLAGATPTPTPLPAVLYVGPGPTLAPLGPALERAGSPVVLLSGDLYSSDGLFRQVFQTTLPWAWQAHVIARYLILDRRYRTIAFIGSGPEAARAAALAGEALAYWGGSLAWASTYQAGQDPPPAAITRAGRADAVIDFGAPSDSVLLARALAAIRPRRPQVVGSAALLEAAAAGARPVPGSIACYTYTWAGWAQPIDRVAAFRRSFQQVIGKPPAGLEQEGYDAVRVLALALKRTDGRGGSVLTRTLESVVRDRVFSSFPVDLGPDDHEFLPRDELGLFAVAGPKEPLDPWEAPGSIPWRPVMRTFTSDGKRTNVLDMDRPVFFPFWTKDQPGPQYWRSRYGIVSRSDDPLH